MTTRVAHARGGADGTTGTIRTQTIAGAGHLATLAEPEAVAEVALELLAAP